MHQRRISIGQSSFDFRHTATDPSLALITYLAGSTVNGQSLFAIDSRASLSRGVMCRGNQGGRSGPQWLSGLLDNWASAFCNATQDRAVACFEFAVHRQLTTGRAMAGRNWLFIFCIKL
jgi:hypothetical protein